MITPIDTGFFLRVIHILKTKPFLLKLTIMTQNEILTANLAAVGEDIGQELGAKMVKDFQDSNPNETEWFYAGRNILDKILSQPGCVGIRMYNAIDENGNKTLVFVGIDAQENIIVEYTTISAEGQLTKEKGIVADRINRPGTKETGITLDWWA